MDELSARLSLPQHALANFSREEEDPLSILATVSSQQNLESAARDPGVLQNAEPPPQSDESDRAADKHEASIEQILAKEPADKPYVCAICLKAYDHPVHLQNHERTHAGQKPYQCEECGRTFGTKAGLQYHRETHRAPAHFCEVCGKGFASARRLEEHGKSHVEERSFICDKCGKAFKNAQALHAHMKLHTGQLRFACDQCDRRFPGRNALAAHKRTHSGEKPFACEVCGVAFRTKGTLAGHRLTHTEDAPFKCDTCGRGFKRKDGLDGHVLSHAPPGVFACDVCGNTYSRMVGLKAHQRTHRRPAQLHTCEFCGKAFTRKDNLGIHRRLHTNELHHQCSECGRLFTHRCRLEKHVREAHANGDESGAEPGSKKAPERKGSKRKRKKQDVEAKVDVLPPINSEAGMWQPAAVMYNDKGLTYDTQQNGARWQAYQSEPSVYDVATYCYPDPYQQEPYASQFIQQTAESQMVVQPEPVTADTESNAVMPVGVANHTTSLPYTDVALMQVSCSVADTANHTPETVYSMPQAPVPVMESPGVLEQTTTNPDVVYECNQLVNSVSSMLASIPPPPVYSVPHAPDTQAPYTCTSETYYNMLHDQADQSTCPGNVGFGTTDGIAHTMPSDLSHTASMYTVDAVMTTGSYQDSSSAVSNITTNDAAPTITTSNCAELSYGEPEERAAAVPDAAEAHHACARCSLSFTSRLQLSLHQRVHQPEFRPFKCDTCHKRFRSKSAVQAHRKTVHVTHERPYACAECPKRFKVKRHLKEHGWCHLPAGEEVLTCRICAKTFKVASYLRRHMKRKHGAAGAALTGEDPKGRDVEGQALERRADTAPVVAADREIKTSTDSKALEGPVGGESNDQASTNLQQTPSVSRAGPAKYKKLECRYCKRRYSNLMMLKLHKSTIHRSKIVFPCDRCGKVFFSRVALQRHTATLGGDSRKQYTCSLCNQTFKFLVNFQRHLSGIHKRSAFESAASAATVATPGDDDCDTRLKSTRKVQKAVYCTVCKFSFKNAARKRHHQFTCRRRTHGSPAKTCERCVVKFKSMSALASHKWSHQSAACRICQRCSTVFTCKQVYSCHIMICNKKGRSSHKVESSTVNSSSHSELSCGIQATPTRKCKKRLSKKLKVNRASKKPRSSGVFRCRKCACTFENRKLLMKHTWAHNKAQVDQPQLSAPSPLPESSSPGACSVAGSEAAEPDVTSQCRICKLKLKSPYQVKSHMQIVHTVERKYACTRCEKRFKIRRHLAEHELTHEPADGSIRCEVCRATFAAPHLLKRHMHRKHGERKFACTFAGCGKRFSEPGQLRQHVRAARHPTPAAAGDQSSCGPETLLAESPGAAPEGKFKCRFCGKASKCKANLDEHEQSHLPAAFFCDICGRGFSVFSYLRRHQKRHRKQACHLCDGAFTMWKDLRTHLIMIHDVQQPRAPELARGGGEVEERAGREESVSGGAGDSASGSSRHVQGGKGGKKKKPEFVCEICGARLRTRASMEAHLLRHSGERPHQCDLCGAAFRTRNTLQGHRVQHTGEYKLRCHVCLMGCRSRSQLAAHVRSHTGERPFPCAMCGLRFATKGVLHGHLATHAGRTPHKCPVCGRGFRRRDGLESHMASHQAPGRFPCDVCGRVYTRLAGMKQHRRSHERPAALHPCPVCHRTFSRKDNLNVHMKLHTNQLPFVCGVCSKGFSHRCRLEKHVKCSHPQSQPSVNVAVTGSVLPNEKPNDISQQTLIS